MRRTALRTLALAALLGAGLVLPGVLAVWVDERGHTYLTDAEDPPAPGAVLLSPDEVVLRWRGNPLGVPLAREAESSLDEDRYLRELWAANDDLARGEVRRGLDRLRHLHATHPGRPEAAWLIAQAERRRGRLEPARAAVEDVLSTAHRAEDPWREAAVALRDEIEADLELDRTHGEISFQQLDTPHFRIHYDHAFAGRDYGLRVGELLGEARAQVQRSLGRALPGELDVRLYTRGRYLESYRHKFGFATVGFYDGAIHVVSARQPREELLALLVHEYAHAVFRDALGSDRPFFLNEGIADREEERVRGRPRLAREEWRRLLDALREETWLPLSSLVRGFGGLQGKQALLAYLESRAVIELLETRRPGTIARWLERAADGTAWERALERETGSDLEDLEARLEREVRERFVADPLARAAAPEGDPQ